MRVLVDNYNEKNEVEVVEPYPRTRICECCGSELMYDESDVRVGFLGLAFMNCPLCRCDNILEDNEKTIDLTINNVEYPAHFWHISVETGAVDRNNNEEVKKEIAKAIEFFRNNKDEYAWSSESGSLHVAVNRYDGDAMYEVVVTNDYYTTSIPFESEDY